MEQPYQYIFKIILIGDSGVGKTSLMNRYTDNTYEQGNASTIGVDFKIKTVVVDGNKIKLQIWDTAGQERFRAIVSHYYRGANGIFIVFDMLNRDSFTHLKDWIDELDKKDALRTAEIRILGNKIDDTSNICVKKEEINQFLSSHNIPTSNFCEVSAKTDMQVEKSFVEMARRLVERCGAPNARQNTKPMLKTRDAKGMRRCC